VYVYRLDRLSRGGIRETLSIVEELRANGCKIETVADGFSLEGPVADVVLAVLAWAAQMERSAIGERIASARQRVEAAGGSWGRPRRILDAQVIRNIKTRHRSFGQSIREIAIALKIPKSTVGSVLSEKGAYKPEPKKPQKRGE
jgi:DNA invertase Pin-like site-specific DNA recombinase